MSSIDDLVVRYLGAYGPASVLDMQSWSGLTRLGEVFERLRLASIVRVFRTEAGRDMFDLPDAPRPDPVRRCAATLPARVRQRAPGPRRPHPPRERRAPHRPAGSRRNADAADVPARRRRRGERGRSSKDDAPPRWSSNRSLDPRGALATSCAERQPACSACWRPMRAITTFASPEPASADVERPTRLTPRRFPGRSRRRRRRRCCP